MEDSLRSKWEGPLIGVVTSTPYTLPVFFLLAALATWSRRLAAIGAAALVVLGLTHLNKWAFVEVMGGGAATARPGSPSWGCGPFLMPCSSGCSEPVVSSGMPSGHATMAMAMLILMSVAAADKCFTRGFLDVFVFVAVFAAFLAFMLTMVTYRVDLGCHTWAQVGVGALLGVPIGVVLTAAYLRLFVPADKQAYCGPQTAIVWMRRHWALIGIAGLVLVVLLPFAIAELLSLE